ncbi:MAG: NAD(P)-dependent oxidoreductase [Magnetococcales bacterium]|nr:NAD(P)-dependent oxidoreductase [Magnetococcales bacterium]
MKGRVLVTGASGFIGRQVVRHLHERGYEVHATALDRLDDATIPREVTWHPLDLLSMADQERVLDGVRPTHLLHLAWNATPGTYWTTPDNLRWVQAGLALLEGFQARGGQRLVLAGSCAEYDWSYGFCSEQTTPVRTKTLYSICKNSLWRIAEGFAARAGLSAACGRVFFLYGPHEYPSRLVPYVIQSLLRGETASCSHGNQIRDFLHVEDVAAGFAALLESPAAGVVNIASGQPVRLREIIHAIADRLGRRDLIRLGAVAVPPDDPPLVVADVRRLTGETGWSPRHDLHTGLAETIAWWRSRT